MRTLVSLVLLLLLLTACGGRPMPTPEPLPTVTPQRLGPGETVVPPTPPRVEATSVVTPPPPSPPPAAAVSAAAPTAAGLATHVIDYAPQLPAGQPRPGTCRSTSLAVPSRAAWRCIAGKETFDPCFTVGDGQHVVCEPNPLAGSPGMPVRLTEPLPQPDLLAERGAPIWLLQLPDETVCRLAPGVTGAVGDKRITYLCEPVKGKSDLVILGDPQPGSVWTAEAAEPALQEGKTIVKSSSVVPLRAVVRGPLLYVPATCSGVAAALSQMLGVDATTDATSFADPLTGQLGAGCRVTATVAGALVARPPEDLLPKMLASQGWREDLRYQDRDPAHSAAAFRRADVLCLLSTKAHGEPRQYTVALRCARDITLPAAAEPAPRPAERIVFAPGATAATLRRPIATGQIQEYVLRALKGQMMMVNVAQAGDGVFLSVYTTDGVALASPTANVRRWQGRLPDTQDYVIKLAGRGDATDLALNLVIPVDLQLPPAGQSAAMKGIVEPFETMYYLLPGTAGQRVTITLTAGERNVILEVAGADDGHLLLPAAAGQMTWAGVLPTSQDYLVRAISSGVRAEYTVEVRVQ